MKPTTGMMSLEDHAVDVNPEELQRQLENIPDNSLDDVVPQELMSFPLELEDSYRADTLISAAVAIEGLRSVLKTKPAHLPFSRAEALAIEAAYAPFLRTAKVGGVFCMERYNGRVARIEEMRVAMEDATEKIRTIISQIVRWIKRAVEVVFDQIESLIRGANATARRAGGIQDLAAKLKAEKGDGEIDGAQIRQKTLAIIFSSQDGGSYSAREIETQYGSLVKDFNETLSAKTAVDGAQYLSAQIGKILNKNKTGAFTKQNALSLSDETINRLLKTNFPQFKAEGDDLVYDAPFGGHSFVLSVSQEEGLKSGMSVVVKNDTKGQQEVLPVLRPSEAVALAKAVEASMHRGMYRDYKAIKSQLWHLKSSVSDMCDEISRQQRETFEGTIPSLHFLKTITETMFNLVRMAYSYNGVVSRAILQYCELSLKQYQKAEKSST